MTSRRRPHPAARSRRAAAWLSIGVATTLGTGMAINGAIASTSGAAPATPQATSTSDQKSSTASTTSTTVKRAATPSTTVPKSSKSRTRAS